MAHPPTRSPIYLYTPFMHCTQEVSPSAGTVVEFAHCQGSALSTHERNLTFVSVELF